MSFGEVSLKPSRIPAPLVDPYGLRSNATRAKARRDLARKQHQHQHRQPQGMAELIKRQSNTVSQLDVWKAGAPAITAALAEYAALAAAFPSPDPLSKCSLFTQASSLIWLVATVACAMAKGLAIRDGILDSPAVVLCLAGSGKYLLAAATSRSSSFRYALLSYRDPPRTPLCRSRRS